MPNTRFGATGITYEQGVGRMSNTRFGTTGITYGQGVGRMPNTRFGATGITYGGGWGVYGRRGLTRGIRAFTVMATEVIGMGMWCGRLVLVLLLMGCSPPGEIPGKSGTPPKVIGRNAHASPQLTPPPLKILSKWTPPPIVGKNAAHPSPPPSPPP